MATTATTAARAATTAAAAAATAAAGAASLPRAPTLTATVVTPPGRRAFGSALDATLRVTTHDGRPVTVAAAATFEIDVAGDGVGGAQGGAAGGDVRPLAASPPAPVAGDGVVHEVGLPLGGALAALQAATSADALCNVGLLRLALVVRGGVTADAAAAGNAAAAGDAAAAAAAAAGDAARAAAVAAAREMSGADAGAVHTVVAERPLVVEVFRDQRAGRVGGADHDTLYRRIFVEE